MQGDPAIRWQTMRDLNGESNREVKRERDKIASNGWGSRLLAKQDPAGTWASTASSDGLYTPKWICTTYTTLLLRDFGLPSNNRRLHKACERLLDGGMQPDGGINYGTWSNWIKRSETCISGMVLSILSYFEYDDDRLDTVAQYLLKQQMPDGGWNCRRERGATHSSVHTTISALEGLRFYEVHRGRNLGAVREAQRNGREFLLMHKMFRSHRTGAIIDPVFLKLAFPPHWHYDILRGLDYFQAVDARRDSRMREAINLVRNSQQADGTWALQHGYAGKTYFVMEQRGKPSRWITLRALRVLKWWDR